MESTNAKSCLKTFLEVSQIQIDMKNKALKRKSTLKGFLDVSKKSEINREMEQIIQERNQIQGRLDAVRLEMLDMILEEPSLISSKLLAKKGCTSVVDFVKQEKEAIELRGLYKENHCSISEILNIGLSAHKDDVSFSMFDKPQLTATEQDVKKAVDYKNVKVMTKTM